ncbi:MAG: peptidoglycan bridge formation glycyltransferase FemA/FemB family protein [Patescibacteria group bacterium]
MEFVYLKSREQLNQLNQFVKKSADVSGMEFLQSFEWGELSQAEGEGILRVAARDNQEFFGAATLIKKPLFRKLFGRDCFYWYVPRGPIGSKEGIEFLLRELKKIKPRALFVRIEPKEFNDGQTGFNGKQRGFGYSQRTVDLQPKKSLLLDLDKSEAELLAAMAQKTRYNIRLAEKKGVKVALGSAADISEFWRLMSLTGNRDNFRLHSKKHYQALLDFNAEFIKLFFASYEGKNIAAGIFCFSGDKVTYLHGASDNEYRNVMAPYLLQWELIKQARRAGYRYYDFFGIDEKRWPGVTRFKLGFGGREVNYPGTFDIVFRPGLYGLYKLVRKVRRII